MNHDITHCNEITCANREVCYRFKAYIEACDRGFYPIVVYSQPTLLECYKKA